jgi:UTP--glucose-1-phosphate uridylyltransferase
MATSHPTNARKEHIMKAVIPAAGMGTRFLPATKALPKELLPVLDKPVIQYVVEEALEPEGVDGVVIVNSHEKPQIESYFSEDKALEDFLVAHGKATLAEAVHAAGELPVSYVYQDDPKGLGHAVLCAAEATGDEPFFVLLGDYFVPDRKMCVHMAEVSAEHGGASVIAVAPVPENQVSRYGIIGGERVGSLAGQEAVADEEPGAVWRISGLVEKPAPEEAPSHLFIVGRYLLSARVMELLRTQGPGAGGEIQLTDALERLLAEEEMYAVVVDPNEGCDTGTPAAWAATNARMALAGDNAMREAFFEGLGNVRI